MAECRGQIASSLVATSCIARSTTESGTCCDYHGVAKKFGEDQSVTWNLRHAPRRYGSSMYDPIATWTWVGLA